MTCPVLNWQERCKSSPSLNLLSDKIPPTSTEDYDDYQNETTPKKDNLIKIQIPEKKSEDSVFQTWSFSLLLSNHPQNEGKGCVPEPVDTLAGVPCIKDVPDVPDVPGVPGIQALYYKMNKMYQMYLVLQGEPDILAS